MNFTLGSETIILCGDPSLGRSLVSLKSMMKTIRLERSGMLVELSHLELEELAVHDEPTYLQGVLVQFEIIFKCLADCRQFLDTNIQ